MRRARDPAFAAGIYGTMALVTADASSASAASSAASSSTFSAFTSAAARPLAAEMHPSAH